MSVLWNTCWPLNLQIRKRATLRRAATALEFTKVLEASWNANFSFYLCCLSLVLWLVVDSFQVILRQTKRWTDSISLSVHHFIVCIGVTYFLPRSHREDLNDSFLKLSLLVWIWTFPISPHWNRVWRTGTGNSRYREFFIFLVVSEPVSEKIVTGKKSLNRYRKNLVPVSVSKIFGTGIGNV